VNPPPEPPDPSALTQPIPIVAPPPPRPGTARPAPPPAGPTGPYIHRFGNVPLTLLARFSAFAIDLVGVAFVLTAFGFNAFDRGIQAFAARNESGFLTLAGTSLVIAIVFAYLCEALIGTTLGKTAFSLHTRRVDGGHAGGGRVLLRYLFAPVDLLLIGPILALVTPRHQRLGDLLAGTVVSGSRLRWFASIVGVALLGGIAYAQIAFGGGLTSAIEVLAETSITLPGVVSKVTQAVGLGAVKIAPLPVPALPAATQTETPIPATSEAPETTASDAPATTQTDTPEPSETETPRASDTGVF